MNECLRHPLAWSGLLAWLAVFFLLASCSAVHAPLRRQVASRGMAGPGPGSVLFIGNSYSFDVPKALRKIAARHGRKIRVGQVTYGGWTLARHADHGEALHEIREGSWDVVIIQEQSRIPSLAESRTDAMFPHVRALADEAREQGSVPMLYQTWGYLTGDPNWSPGDDFTSMNRRLREGYRAAAASAGGLAIIPIGDAWEREIRAGRGARLFQSDGCHPTRHGNMLTAQVVFETLFPYR